MVSIDLAPDETTGTADTQLMRAVPRTIPAPPPSDRPSFEFAPGAKVHVAEDDIPLAERNAPELPRDRVSLPVELVDRLVAELHQCRLNNEANAQRDRQADQLSITMLAMQEQLSRANSGITTLLFQRGAAVSSDLLGLHVLLVEDFAPLANAVGDALTSAGAKLTTRARYIDAVAWLSEPWHELDVAVLDIRLGDGDGITLARRIRDQHPRCAIVLTTGADSSEYTTQARAIHVGLLAKPHSPAQLLDAVADQIDEVRA